MNFHKDWNQFWFAQYSPVPLGLCRIAIGCFTCVYGMLLFPDRFIWFGNHAMFSADLMTDYGGRSMGPRPFAILSHLPSDAYLTLFFIVFGLAAILFTIGLFTNVSAFVVFVGLNALHLRAPVINNSGDILMVVMCFYLLVSPSGRACSVDRLIASWHGRALEIPRSIDSWPLRLIQIQVSIIYFQSWTAKLPGNLWANGTAVYYALSYPELHRFAVPPLTPGDLWLINIMTYFAMATEFSMATFVWVPRLRLYCIAAGVMLHLGIEYAMNIPLFSGLIISSYIAFLRPSDLEVFSRWVRYRLPRLSMKLVYDGDCDFCKSVIMIVHMMDPFRVVTLLNSTRSVDMETVPEFSTSAELDSLTAIDWHGKQRFGFYAIRSLMWRLPALWLAVPWLYIPGASLLGTRAYAWVKENRGRLPVAAQFRPTIVKVQ